MAQQMVNGSHYDGSITITIPMSKRYAVINPPFQGKHMKPQDSAFKQKRKDHWTVRNLNRTKVEK